MTRIQRPAPLKMAENVRHPLAATNAKLGSILLSPLNAVQAFATRLVGLSTERQSTRNSTLNSVLKGRDITNKLRSTDLKHVKKAYRGALEGATSNQKLACMCAPFVTDIVLRRDNGAKVEEMNATVMASTMSERPLSHILPCTVGKAGHRLSGGRRSNYFPPTDSNTVHFPSTTLYTVMPPSFKSPRAS